MSPPFRNLRVVSVLSLTLLLRRPLRRRRALGLGLQSVRQLLIFGCELKPALGALGRRILGRALAAPIRLGPVIRSPDHAGLIDPQPACSPDGAHIAPTARRVLSRPRPCRRLAPAHPNRGTSCHRRRAWSPLPPGR